MSEVLFALDFLFPLFFLALGRALRGKRGRKLVRESLIAFCAALLFAPIVFLYASLPVQGVFCAGILLAQSCLLSAGDGRAA